MVKGFLGYGGSVLHLQLNDFAWMKCWQLPLVIEDNARLQREARFMADDLPRF
jgi:hypothetical protein